MAKERESNLRIVAKSESKVEAQLALIAAMSPDDPRLPGEKRMLAEMRHNAASAATNKAFLDYDEEN